MASVSISAVLRDRLVGGLFVLALGAILVPMWFDGAGVQDLPELNPSVTPIPAAAPNAPLQTDGEAWQFTEQMEGATANGELAGAEAGERTQLGQPRTRSDGEAAAVSGAAELPWTVQVASLSALPAGKQLKDKLLAAGYHAYVSTGARSDGVPTVRVAVGPFVDRSQAERVRAELQARMGLQGILKRFDL